MLSSSHSLPIKNADNVKRAREAAVQLLLNHTSTISLANTYSFNAPSPAKNVDRLARKDQTRVCPFYSN